MKVTGNNIRVVVERLQTEHPGAGQTELVSMLAERMQNDRAVREAAALYVIKMAVPLRACFDTRLQLRSAPAEQQARERAGMHTAAATAAAQVLLLNLAMPNGKPMRLCTGAEMAGFGAGYARIAEKVGKANLVGAVLTEAQLQALIAQDQRQVLKNLKAA
jgi:hypothetical protein